MPLETEIKLRVTDHAMMVQRLKDAGARFIRREMEINTFLDTPDAALLRGGSGLRVRLARDLETGARRAVITHKGPKRSGAMKIRPETEAAVSSYDHAVALLQAMGYEVKLSFEKRRETWELGGCEVVLDELPSPLGRYVEIEGADVVCVQAVRGQLQLIDAIVESEGYAVLVAGHLRQTGGKNLVFA
jgi:predicted adenylyl cyclase CyaB